MKLSISESEFFSSVKANDISAARKALCYEPYLVSFQDEIGKAPLTLAVENGLAEMIKELIAHGASIDITDQDANSLLHLAIEKSLHSYDSIRENFIEIAIILLDSGINVNATNSKGFSCLHNAAGSGDKQMVLFLVEKGANVNSSNDEGFTPFLWSLCANVWERDIPKYLDTLEALVESGADLNAITSQGETALDLAKKWNPRPPFIKFLKVHGAK